MSKEITVITIEMSDGQKYSLKTDHIKKLFAKTNPISSYLALVFSP